MNCSKEAIQLKSMVDPCVAEKLLNCRTEAGWPENPGKLKLMPSHCSTENPIAPVGMDEVTELAPAATFPQVLAFASRLALAKTLDATVPVGQVVVPPALAAGALALEIILTKAIEKIMLIFVTQKSPELCGIECFILGLSRYPSRCGTILRQPGIRLAVNRTLVVSAERQSQYPSGMIPRCCDQ